PVSIASGKTLSGAITVTAGSIKLDQTGTLASAIKMSGGKLDADNSMTISGAVTQAGNAAIDVQSGKTLTFDNGTINTENYQLTLEGAGTVAFPTNASGIVLNNADGIVKLNGTGVTVQAVKVSTAANAGKGILVNKSGTFSNLKISADTELNITNGKTLYGSTEVAANKTLSLIGTGTLNSALNLEGTLEAGANLTVSGAISVADNATVSIPNANTTLTYSGGNLNVGVHTLSIAGAGRFSNSSNSPIVLAVEESILDLKGSGTITGPVKLDGEGSTLKASGSPTISGNITQSDNATIEVASNQTLSYSGTSLNLGANKLSLTGGGTLSNSNTLVLNNADSLLSLEGIGTIGVVRATVNANSGKGIQAVESATLGSFELAATSFLDIAASKTINGPIKLQNNGDLTIKGSGEYLGDLELAGGKFRVDSDVNVPVRDLAGTLSITANSEIIVPQSYSLVLNQTGTLPLGGSTLSSSGAGKLKFEKVINVSGGELEVSSGTLHFVSGGSGGSTVSVLALEGATLVLNGNLSIGDKLKTSGDDPTLQLNGNNLDLSGNNVQLELGTGLVLDGVLTGTNTELLLTEDSTISRASPFTLGSINLQNKALTLGSATSDMTVTGAVTFDSPSSQILTGEADLALQSSSGFDLLSGKLSSTGGTLSLPYGMALGSGSVFDFSGSIVEFSGTLNNVQGTISSSSSSTLVLQAASSFSSSAVFTIPTLDLNSQALTLNTSSTHLALSNPFTVGASESVNTQTGSLTLNGSGTLEDNGTIESSAGSLTFNGSVALDNASLLLTGGSVALNSGAAISGGELKLFDSSLTLAGNVGMTNDSTLSLKNTVINPGTNTIGMTGGTLGLGGTYSNFGAVQTDNTTSLELNAATTISSNSAMVIGGLGLNNFTLTLGSATTDLTIQSALTVDSSNSQLITNTADLTLTSPLQLTAGSITSTAGTFS
ncbi:MAG: hypothetical protein P8L36_11245, partial [SAR324 cluster bacterium]|nr:hypothetical protein [SAR324 cluster bacterium]